MPGPKGASEKLASASLVGRVSELNALLRASEECQSQQESRTVTLVGGKGTGKTRLVNEWGDRARQFRLCQGRCQSADQPFSSFARLLRSRFALSDDLDLESAQRQLRLAVTEVLDDRRVGDVCFVLGQILGLEFMDSPVTRAVAQDPKEAEHLRRAVVRNFLEADAAKAPLALVLDDLHNADDASLELLGYLIESINGPALFLCVTRPELLRDRASWFDVGPRRHVRLDVGALQAEEVRQLAAEVLPSILGDRPKEVLELVVSRSAGVPGRLEDVLSSLWSAGVFREQSDKSDTSEAIETHCLVDLERLKEVILVPHEDESAASLVGSLPTEQRRVLEQAAAMGSVFWLGGLLALARVEVPVPEFWIVDAEDERVLKETLAQLIKLDHVLAMPDSTFPGDNEYVFKHNREREAAAALVSPSMARRYHHALADWLVQKDEVRSQEEYWAMVADHLERAGARARAASAFLEAADIARLRFKVVVAEEYYRKGLFALEEQDVRRRIDGLHNYGEVLLALGRREDALSAFREMLGIAFRLGLYAKGAAAHACIGRVLRDVGPLADARRHFDVALELYRAASDLPGVAACHDDIGTLLWQKGEFDSALEQLRKGLELRRALADKRNVASSLSNIGRVLVDQGELHSAYEAFDTALNLRREVADSLGVVDSLVDLGRLSNEQSDDRNALTLYQEAYAVVLEIGERTRTAQVMTYIGQTYVRLGEFEQSVKVLLEAEELSNELGDKIPLGEAQRSLSEAYLALGDLRKARDSIKRAVDLLGQLKSKLHLAHAVRTLGQVTAAGAWGKDHRAKAADYFMRSIAIYKETGNELETARSYKAFVAHVRDSEDHKDKPDVLSRAERLDQMADEILARRKRSSLVR